MGFFGKLLYKLSNFMQGRYGIDALNVPILILSCICTFLGTICWSVVLRLIGFLLIVWLVCRALSKNHAARRRELDAYYNLKNKFFSWKRNFSIRKEQRSIRKEQKAIRKEQKKFKCYFKCPKCKAELSVPKGKGKIQITCKKCGHKFIKKT